MTIGTLADLARIEGMPSEPTLRRFIATDAAFPIVQRGRLGLAYRIDLQIAAAYVRAHWLDKRTKLAVDANGAELPPPVEVETPAWAGSHVGTLTDLGAINGMPSMPSLQRFIAGRSDFPILQRGRYGVRYLFDLDAAVAFVRANWSDGRRRASATQSRLAGDAGRQGFLPGFGPETLPGEVS